MTMLSAVRSRQLDRDCEALHAALSPLREPAKGFLVATVGLPGSGKSHFARALARRVEVVHLESDRLRRVLFPTPRHGYKESARLFRAIHTVAETYLRDSRVVILDSTNLREEHRQQLVAIGERCGCPLLLVELTAPEGLIVQRLKRRSPYPDQAGIEVYVRMRAEAQPIQAPHRSVDTSRSISEVVRQIAGEIENL